MEQNHYPNILRMKSINMLLSRGWKHLCWSLLLILSIPKSLRAAILKKICEQLFLKMRYWEKLKFINKEF